MFCGCELEKKVLFKVEVVVLQVLSIWVYVDNKGYVYCYFEGVQKIFKMIIWIDNVFSVVW